MMSGFLYSIGHFEEKCCHPSLLFDLVSRGLIRGYLGLLIEERTLVLPCPVQLIHHGVLALDSLRLKFNGVNMNITVNCRSSVQVEGCGLLFQ